MGSAFSTPCRGRRGSAMVEMALILPLVLLLVFGMIDFGLALRDSLALSQVAREAARSAALGTSSSIIQGRVSSWATSLGLKGPVSATVSTGANPGDQCVVTLRYTHQMVSGSLLGMGSDLALKTTMVMRRE